MSEKKHAHTPDAGNGGPPTTSFSTEGSFELIRALQERAEAAETKLDLLSADFREHQDFNNKRVEALEGHMDSEHLELRAARSRCEELPTPEQVERLAVKLRRSVLALKQGQEHQQVPEVNRALRYLEDALTILGMGDEG